MSTRSMNSTLSLPEIGKRLAPGVTQKEALLKLLKAAASQLQEVQQSAGPGTTAAIKPCVEAIVKPVYLNHRDKDVRLFAAQCCSEALRVFAPDPPYSDPQLKEIFELVVEIFHRLSEVQNETLINRVVGILETLAKVKTCIVMLDLELDKLVLKMFEVFFSTISQKHAQNVHTAMLDIMATILEESEEISQGLLDAVLVNLLGRRKEQSPAAYGLAVRLVQRCADRLQPVVQRFFTTVMQDPQSVESRISEEYHEVILEIYITAPQMLVAVLPHLLEELGIDDVEKRMKAVTMLGKLFSIPEQHADQDYRQLYLEYMGRFVDKSMDIRLKMLELSQAYLLNISSNGQDHFEAIAARLMDFEEKVRFQAVKVICTVAQAKPNMVPMQVLKQVAGRLRDKKLTVRRLTLPELSKVYRQYCTCLFEGKAISDEEFHWIPSSILRCCFDKEVKDFRPQLMDLFLDEELFPNKLSIEDRVKNWISMYAVFEEIDIRALEAIFKNKSRIQQEMNKYLEIRQKMKEEGGSDLQNQVQVCFKNVATAFVDSGKAEEHLGKLHQLKDNNIFKALSTLLNPKTTYAQARACRDDLLKRIGEKHPQHEFIKHLATKISFTLFGEEHVSAVMKLINDGKLANDNQLLFASIKLLVEVSAHFSILFGPVQEDLVKLLTEGDDVVKEGVAHILANTGVYMRNMPAEQSSLISETLQRLALEGTRRQAKHAVLAIAAISEDSGLRDLSVLYTRVVDALGDSGNLPTMFQTLGVIAQHSIPIFETREDGIVKFIMRNVLKRPSEDAVVSDEKEQNFDWNKPSTMCHLKICGLKVLVKSFLPFKQTSHRAKLKGLLNVIQNLVPQGELGEDLACKSRAVDRAHIRLAAAKAVLQLSRRYDHYIQSDFPELLLPTLLLAQDACLQVRQKFVAKVHEYLHLRENPLPTKFACTFALQLTDVDKDNVSNSKRFLTEFVETSRRDAHLRQAKAAAGSSDSSVVTFLPEYVLVYLVHVLAHHPDFPKSSNDPGKYEPFKVQMQGFIQALLQLDGEGKSEQDPLPLIFAIFRTIKNIGEDALNSERTELVFAVCDIGIMVAKDLGRKRLYSSEYAAAIPLPSSLYKAPSVAIEGQRKVDGSDLPKCLVEDSNKQKSKAAPYLKAVQASSTRGRKRGKFHNGDAATELQEVGDIEVATKHEGRSPKKARNERKVVSPAVLGDMAGGEMVNKEVSPATRSTPRKKAMKSPENERKTGGEELIGRRIQVWWPIDKLFYYGRIQAYDPKKNQHRVLYDDGDEETLVLAKERWDFVDNAGQLAEERLPPALTAVSVVLPLAGRTPESTGTTLKPKDSSTTKQITPSGRKGKSESQGSKRKREAGETEDSPNAKAGFLEHTPEVRGTAQKDVTPVAAFRSTVEGTAPLEKATSHEGEMEGGKATHDGTSAAQKESAFTPDPVANGNSEQDSKTTLEASSLPESNIDGLCKPEIPVEITMKEATEVHIEVSLPTRRGGRGKAGERKKSAANEAKSPAEADDDADQNGKAKRGRPKGSGKKDKKQAAALQEETAEAVKHLDTEGASGVEKDVHESKKKDANHKEEGTDELSVANGNAKLHDGGKDMNAEDGNIQGGDGSMAGIGEHEAENAPMSGNMGEGNLTGIEAKIAPGLEVVPENIAKEAGGVEEGHVTAMDEGDEPSETVRRRSRKSR